MAEQGGRGDPPNKLRMRSRRHDAPLPCEVRNRWRKGRTTYDGEKAGDTFGMRNEYCMRPTPIGRPLD